MVLTHGGKGKGAKECAVSFLTEDDIRLTYLIAIFENDNALLPHNLTPIRQSKFLLSQWLDTKFFQNWGGDYRIDGTRVN